MKLILFVFTLIAVIGGLFIFAFRNTMPVVGASTAVSTEALRAAQKDPPFYKPQTQTKSIACSLSATLITNDDGTQQASFTWNYTPGSIAWIDQDTGFLPADKSDADTAISPVLTGPTTFTLMASDGVATSTCQTMVTPDDVKSVTPIAEPFTP